MTERAISQRALSNGSDFGMALRRSAARSARPSALSAVHSAPARWPVSDRASGGTVADLDQFAIAFVEQFIASPLPAFPREMNAFFVSGFFPLDES